VSDQNIFLNIPFSNTFSLCSSVNLEGQVSHPYATSGVIIVLSSKGHPNKMLFADKKQYLMYKNRTVQIKIQHSICFLYLIHKRYDTFLRTSQYFLYIYDRCITFFMKVSQVPSYSTLHQSPDNTLHLLLKIGL